MTRLLFGCGLGLVVVVAACSAQEPNARTSHSSRPNNEESARGYTLDFINIPATELPKHVRLVPEIRTAPMIPITRNPDVVVDPEWMAPIAMFFDVYDEPDLRPVNAVFVAVYQEKDPANEIGVYGLHFSDKSIADEHFKKLREDYKESEGASFIQKGQLLLHVWKDNGVSDSAFEAVRDYFTKATYAPPDRS